jgi:hypothetical protein
MVELLVDLESIFEQSCLQNSTFLLLDTYFFFTNWMHENLPSFSLINLKPKN